MLAAFISVSVPWTAIGVYSSLAWKELLVHRLVTPSADLTCQYPFIHRSEERYCETKVQPNDPGQDSESGALIMGLRVSHKFV